MVPRIMPSIIEGTIRSLRDEIYTNKGYKVMFQGAEFIKLKAYPNLLKWEAIFKKLNPNGTFSSDFSDRLGLGQLEDLAVGLVRETGYKRGSSIYKKFISSKTPRTNED